MTMFMASPLAADPFAVVDGVGDLFGETPRVEQFAKGETPCGMGRQSNPHVGYCASDRTLYLVDDIQTHPEATYEVAHVLGHYLQIRYGVADIALREISARRDEEDALRSMVTRQVECLAGVMMAMADQPFVDLRDMFEDEHMTDAHWGRAPINSGPRVSIGRDARAQWYRRGYDTANVAACTVEEMSADLLVRALR